MNVLIINGAPRSSGFTLELVDLVSKGIQLEGAKPTVIHLNNLRINPCAGCFECWYQVGKCVHSDDMQSLIEQYYQSDIVLLATPLYFYSFSSGLKRFLERLLPLTKPNPTEGVLPNTITNELVDPNRTPSRMALLATAAHRNPRIFDGLCTSYDLIANALGARSVGKLLRTESHFLDFLDSKPKVIKAIKNAFTDAGRQLAVDGEISKQTESDLSQLITPNEKLFKQHFKTYWQIFRETRSTNPSRKQLINAVGKDLRILMPEIASHLDTKAAQNVNATFAFQLDGLQPSYWTLSISNGKCVVSDRLLENPSVMIHTTSEILIEVVRQRLDIRKVLANKTMRVTGDKRLFMQFGKLFPFRVN